MSHKVSIFFVVVILALIGIYAAFFMNPTGQLTAKDSFAQCLSEKGAIFYGADWCGHCKNQKAMFGNSMQYINYVECTQNQDLCRRMGVEAYPTWIIDGKKYTGVKTLEELASLSGCPTP